MNFLRPEFLWALPLAAVPILLHLLNRRRYQVVAFGAMEFLRRAVKRTRRRLLLEDLLLLLLRTCAVVFLILALARPGADPESLLAGRPARAEVLLLDGSMSMAHRDQGTSAFERAKEAGAARLDDLEIERGDGAALVLAGARAERLAYGDPGEIRLVLDALDAPGSGGARMVEALALARASADGLSSEGAESVRVTVLTDLQATGFDLEGAEGAGLRAIQEAGHGLALVDTGAVRRSNTAVIELLLEPDELSPGAFGEVRARIRHFGEDARDPVRITLLMDGVPVTSKELRFGPGEELPWSHAIAPSEVGPRAIELRLDGDALAIDDLRAAILPVRPPPQVALVGESAPAREPEGAFDSLSRYFDLGDQAPLEIVTLAPGAVREGALAAAQVLILADPGGMSPSALEEIARFHERGGGTLLALGPRTQPAAAAMLLESLRAQGIEVGGVETAVAPSARLTIRDPEFPALQLFQDPRWQPLLTEVPHARFRSLRIPEAAEAGAGPMRVPLGFIGITGEEPAVELGPALVVWEGDGGRVAALAAVPMPGWNSMLEVPGGTLPFLFDLLAWLVPRPLHALRVEAGGSLVMELPRAPAEIGLEAPSGTTFRPTARAGALPGGRVLQPLVEHADETGVWTTQARLLAADGGEVLHIERFAVVSPVGESDLRPVDETALAALLPGAEILRPGGIVATAEVEERAAGTQDLSALLYALVAGVLVAETLLAAGLDRRRG
ncbi:MAG TPA: BatA and WFA domain-containing protein [Planctomycetota bacterium]